VASCAQRTKIALLADGARRARAESPRGADGAGDGCAEGDRAEAEDGRHGEVYMLLVRINGLVELEVWYELML
jgi:hypothetical protein